MPLKPAQALSVRDLTQTVYAEFQTISGRPIFKGCRFPKPEGAILDEAAHKYVVSELNGLAGKVVHGNICILAKNDLRALVHVKRVGEKPAFYVVVKPADKEFGEEMVKKIRSLLPRGTNVDVSVVIHRELMHPPQLYSPITVSAAELRKKLGI